MNTPCKTLLVSKLPWTQVLDLLDIPYASQILPAAVSCPHCRKPYMEVFRDYTCSGFWYACSHCGQGGDMIQLASRVWDLPFAETCEKLAVIPGFEYTPGALQHYLKLLARRTRVQDAWQQARSEHLHHSTSTHERLLTLNLPRTADDLWTRGAGHLLGSLPIEVVERTLSSKNEGKPLTVRTMIPKLSMFRSWGKGDVIVLPFSDMPGRVCSFLAIGRKVRPDRDFLFKNIISRKKVKDKYGVYDTVGEAGLNYHPGIFKAAKQFDNTVIGVGDPLMAVRLQHKHYEGSLLPLPLVSWYEGRDYERHGYRTQKAWSIFHRQKLILWAPKLDTQTVRQIVQTGAMVSTWASDHAETEESLRTYLGRQVTLDILRNVRQTALPWPEALAKAFDGMPEERIEELVRQFEVEGVEITPILDACRGEGRRKIDKLLAAGACCHYLTLGDEELISSPGGWFRRRRLTGINSPELVCDARLRIDTIRQVGNKASTAVYTGSIEYKGETIPFIEKRSVVEDKTFWWMRNFLMGKQRGYMNFDQEWSNRAVSIAARLHAPKFELAYNKVGWSSGGQRFVFPRFSIDTTGYVDKFVTTAVHHWHSAHTLLPPTVMSPEELAGPQDEIESAAYWGTIAAVMANGIAPALGKSMSGIALRGTNATQYGHAVAEAMGCRRPNRMLCPDLSGSFCEIEQESLWPTRVPRGLMFKCINRQWRDFAEVKMDGGRRCLAEISLPSAAVLKLQGGWHILAANPAADLSPHLADCAAKFLPAYLEDVCKRRLSLHTREVPGVTWFDDVLYDMSVFVQENGGKAERVMAAGDYVCPDNVGGYAGSLVELIFLFTDRSYVQFHWADQCRDRWAIRVNLIRKDGNRLFIPKQALADMIEACCLPRVDPDRISAALRHGGVLKSETKKDWVVNNRWFQDTYRLMVNTIIPMKTLVERKSKHCTS